MAYDINIVLDVTKSRLNRLREDTTLDAYLIERIRAADEDFAKWGVKLCADSSGDNLLLSDYVVWRHNNRDQPGGMPEWLRLARRERWVAERRGGIDSG